MPLPQFANIVPFECAIAHNTKHLQKRLEAVGFDTTTLYQEFTREKCVSKKPLFMWVFLCEKSEWWDLNPRPLRPERSTLTGLSYTPQTGRICMRPYDL